MQRLKSSSEYYLQVVEEGQSLNWPKDEESLKIGSKSLDEKFTQYWAYPKDAETDAKDLPRAETLAAKNPHPIAAILVDQSTPDGIDLILTKDGHAWVKVESTLESLEENVNSLVELSESKFHFNVEHFMTTNKVSKEVEEKLNSLEDKENNEEKEVESSPVESHDKIGPERNQFISSGISMSDKPSSKIGLILLILVIVALVGAAVFFREQIFSRLGIGVPGLLNGSSTDTTPTPSLEPTSAPTPTPVSIDRSKTKIRVLNGTSQSGAAAALGDKLKALGWQVLSVGNATSSAIAQTQVRVKEGNREVGDILAKDLKDEDLEATVSSTLNKDSTADAEVIIGKE